jgi:ATP-dependent RNA helicase RhlE
MIYKTNERRMPAGIPSTQPPPLQQQTNVSQGVFKLLIPELRRAVSAEGYAHPTPIQEQCIPLMLAGRDILGTAQTGTGKTAAFVLPLLQKLSETVCKPQKGAPRALILAPTRELAAQIDERIGAYGRFLPLRHTVISGGVNQNSQVRALNRGIDILVATPGRLLDLIHQGFVRLNNVEFFILDEVDRMLDMGFIPDVQKILAIIPKNRQTLFFSATMPPKMESLARTMVHNPERITISPDKPALEQIDQKVMFVGKRDKNDLLISLLNAPGIDKALIFTQMKHMANRLTQILSAAGIQCTAIHGNKTQSARNRALDGFKQGQYRVLVATDVAARGLDVNDITHVINYDLPIEPETYVHRIGRTARAGADGDAISFCCSEDRAHLREIETLLGESVPIEKDHAYHSEMICMAGKPAPRRFGISRRGGGGRRYTRLGSKNRARG